MTGKTERMVFKFFWMELLDSFSLLYLTWQTADGQCQQNQKLPTNSKIYEKRKKGTKKYPKVKKQSIKNYPTWQTEDGQGRLPHLAKRVT